MLKINIICVGNLKENYLKDAQQEYKKRISRYAKIEIFEAEEAKISSFDNELLINKTLVEEGKNMMKIIKPSDFVFLIDLHGKEMDSVEFSKELDKAKDVSQSTIDFVIGGTLGLSDELRKRANKKVCLSKLTFPHQLTRIILLEQLYRAFKILNNESYHH